MLVLGGTTPGVLRKAPSGPSSPVNAMPSSAADRLEPAAAFPAIRKAGTVNICVVTYREQAPARFQASCQGPARPVGLPDGNYQAARERTEELTNRPPQPLESNMFDVHTVRYLVR